MADMSKEAIRKRWQQHQRRSAGGWIKVPGQPDPAADVEALLVMMDGEERQHDTIDELIEKAVLGPVAEEMGMPAPVIKPSNRKPRKRRAKAMVDARKVDKE